jgi:DNA-binding FrmR family transcriptional regulator
MSHANDPKIVGRLRRAEGHLGSVLRMVQDGRDAITIAQQLSAVIQALEKAKGALVLDHIENHLEEVVGPLPKASRERLSHLGELVKYL